MIVIGCGGRDFVSTPERVRLLAAALRSAGARMLIHGDCDGADQAWDAAANEAELQVFKAPAQWAWGRPAGPRRNRTMALVAEALNWKTGIEVECWALPGDTGTEDMVRRASELFRVRRFSHECAEERR